MNLEEAIALTTATQSGALGKKQPGQLIQAGDWNTLVEILAAYGLKLKELDASVAQLGTDLGALQAKVAPLDPLPAAVADLTAKTAPLLQNYLVEISANDGDYLVGESAEITVRVRALDGQTLTGALPWVDFFATWGRLRPAPGFVAREDAEENALSVQVNPQGIARVLLRSQHTKGIAATDEAQFAKTIQAQVGTTGRTVKQIVQQAASPGDSQVRQAYKMVHASYAASPSQQQFLDGYIGNYTGGIYWGGWRPRGEWEDYRATVIAFAKPDADPLSPDPARGVATIQINFREWIPNWVGDFWGDLVEIQTGFDQFFLANLGKNTLLDDTLIHLDQTNKDAGLLAKIRNTRAMHESIVKINPGSDPDVRQTKDLLEGAMQMQLSAGIGTAGGSDVARSYATQAKVTQEAGRQAQAARTDAGAVKTVKAAVDVLEGKMQASETTAREIKDGLARIGDGVNKINVVEVADLGTRLQKISTDLSAINLRLPR